MFLNSLQQRNPQLVELGFRLHQQGVILPDTYLLDLEAIESNARTMKREADKQGVELYFMSKQMGRNPAVCHSLLRLGFPGAVVVDFREAEVMMKNNIPIAHAGHLVQMPDHFLPDLLEYGVGLLTVYSIEKAERINRICKARGKVQDIALKFYREGDFIYPSQEAGFALEQLPQLLHTLKGLPNIRVAALTSFPCFLYHAEKGGVVGVSNLQTVQEAQRQATSILGYAPLLNLPSCTQTANLQALSEAGGSSGEPGSSLIGMTPNNQSGQAVEMPALLYISEVSHSFEEHSYCYGGGHYRRGQIAEALVGSSVQTAQKRAVEMPTPDNIDYHFAMKGSARVGDTVAMCFRTQIFVTRSQVALIAGLQTGKPMLEGIYTAQGECIKQGCAL